MEAAGVSYSTLSPSAIVSRILPEYDLGEIVGCEFLTRGLNDTFYVRTRDASYALRVYRVGWRSRSEIEWELDALVHLDRKGVPVAAPIANRRGRLLSQVEQPEGPRHVVLFNYAHGEQTGGHEAGQPRVFGIAAAEMHLKSEDFVSRHERFRLDLAHLIDDPLSAILPVLERRQDDRKYLEDFARRVRERIAAVQSNLDFGFCHGDLHGVNAAYGPGDRVVMFDFDCGGPGWRSYDIAVYRWAAALRSKDQNWKEFVDGYQERRRLPASDLEAVPLFVAARCIWIMGLHTCNAPFLGRSFMNDQYFDYWLKFIRDWEVKELGGKSKT
jgi:Ser/Thr protein kinase RdoA (MazF antagonist)